MGVLFTNNPNPNRVGHKRRRSLNQRTSVCSPRLYICDGRRRAADRQWLHAVTLTLLVVYMALDFTDNMSQRRYLDGAKSAQHVCVRVYERATARAVSRPAAESKPLISADSNLQISDACTPISPKGSVSICLLRYDILLLIIIASGRSSCGICHDSIFVPCCRFLLRLITHPATSSEHRHGRKRICW